MLNLGFIGFGEAGYYMSKDLLREKVDVWAFDQEALQNTQRSVLIQRRAEENQVKLVDSLEALVARADIFFCLTSANSALPIAKQAAPMLHKGQIYTDMNSTSPKVKEQIHEVFLSSSEADFVEAAVMSSVPTNKTKVPITLDGARGQELTNLLNEIGMNVKFLDETIGKASAIKMLKSILAKGIIAVVTETIFCTEQYGVTDIVLNGEKNFLEELGFIEYCSHDVTQAATHNERFQHEMEEVLSTVESMGENGIMTKAAVEKFRWMNQMGFGKIFTERPQSYHEVIDAKNQLCKGKMV